MNFYFIISLFIRDIYFVCVLFPKSTRFLSRKSNCAMLSAYETIAPRLTWERRRKRRREEERGGEKRRWRERKRSIFCERALDLRRSLLFAERSSGEVSQSRLRDCQPSTRSRNYQKSSKKTEKPSAPVCFCNFGAAAIDTRSRWN